MKIIQSLDDGAEEFPILLRRALFTGEAWFDLLNERGEIQILFESESYSRARSLRVWLSTLAEKRPATVAALMRNWWKKDPSRNEQLIEWFGFLQLIRLHPSLIALLRDVLHSPLGGHTLDQYRSRIVRIVQNLCETEPEASVKILSAFCLRHGLRLFHKCICLPTTDRTTLYTFELPVLADKAPGVFLDVMTPILTESVQISFGERSLQ